MRSCKLFLGGLTKHTTTELLYETFSPYGLVVDAVVMERNGSPRGFGFVTFAEESSVDAVLRHQVLIDNREVDIKRAVPEEEMEHVPTKVFVGGLPQKVDRAILKTHFARYGDVRDCVVMMDRTTGRSRGFGFVRFSSPEAVEAVLSAPQVLEGQVVDCKRAQPAETLPPPKNPRSRGDEKPRDRRRRQAPEVAVPDLASQWLQMLATPGFQPFGALDWSAFDPAAYEALAFPAFDPAAFPAAFDPAAFDPAAFDPAAFGPAFPMAFDPTHVDLPAPSLPINEAKAKALTPLGDLSNLQRSPTKAEPSPLGDLSNLLSTREKRGFPAALKAAMKEEAASAASLAFAH